MRLLRRLLLRLLLPALCAWLFMPPRGSAGAALGLHVHCAMLAHAGKPLPRSGAPRSCCARCAAPACSYSTVDENHYRTCT